MADVQIGDIVFAVAVAVAVGGGAGLLVGFTARHFGWPTGFVGPLAGGIVSAQAACEPYGYHPLSLRILSG